MSGTEPIRPIAAFDPRAEAAQRVVQQDAERDADQIDQQAKQKKARAQQNAADGQQSTLPRQAFDVFIHREEDSAQPNPNPQGQTPSSGESPADQPSQQDQQTEEEEAVLPLVQPDVALQISPTPEVLQAPEEQPEAGESAPLAQESSHKGQKADSPTQQPAPPEPAPEQAAQPEPSPAQPNAAAEAKTPSTDEPPPQPADPEPTDDSPPKAEEKPTEEDAPAPSDPPPPAQPADPPPSEPKSTPEPKNTEPKNTEPDPAKPDTPKSPPSDPKPAPQVESEPAPPPKAENEGAFPDWQQLFRDRYKPQVLHLNQAMATLIDWHEHRQQAQWASGYPAPLLDDLWRALRHATLLGGKRFRPILIFESAAALGLSMEDVTGLACAVECIHTQSLVFDDLPALDNDDLRRGQPTVHKAFDEATAILVGDALACMAFGTMAQWGPDQHLPADKGLLGLELVRQLSDVASLQGLVNGQFADLRGGGESTPEADRDDAPDQAQALGQLRYIQANKTAALIRYCLRAPGILAGVPGEVVHQLDVLGSYIGELFQVVDDLLDVRGSQNQLGKTPGKDEAQQKLTATRLMGVEAADQHARDLVKQADELIDSLAPRLQRVDGLRFLCHYGLWRLH